ncbi:MAG: amidohydrolase, partial [Kribbellaceae bacterium]|nr:amidohydrolase [Kribbellaceae bacterium]
GPRVLLRADLDALPVEERTGLAYASTARGTDPDGKDVPVMHACGHDVHVTCLLGAVEELARRDWSGTIVAVFQPAEELGTGALAMIDDNFFGRFGVPDVVLGQHVGPFPAGTIAVRSGPAFAATDALSVVFHGRGGHGSRPETTIDPVVMAAYAVTRLQTIVSREVAATDTAVVTVGSIVAGTKDNIIPDTAELKINIRSYAADVRARIVEAVERIIRAEALASGAVKDPEITLFGQFPVVVNTPDATAKTQAAFVEAFGERRVFDPGLVTGSEDVVAFATASGAPLCFWLLGGADPERYLAAEREGELSTAIPSNHSPFFAPVEDPTLDTGVQALVTAALTWLGQDS